MKQMGLDEKENVQINEGEIVLNSQIVVNGAYYCQHCILGTFPLYTRHFFALANFLGALNRHLGSNSFLTMVAERCISGKLEPECANLAGCTYRGAQMLFAGSASIWNLRKINCFA
ncbi:hypothetical protein AVEN_270710-1 [Araneus ventricosus]|uniref:Uncharacterized protein n=1 Tax=Araneus ventricosus TaxID=182803 RepID=A0A4Y2FG95_ARAVE|nr:hypothetical protein AVEN_270710-1 [Araneus ventricosus]